MSLLVGVDPGLKGAIAVLDTARMVVDTFDMPGFRLNRGGKLKGEVDAHHLAHILYTSHADHAFLEQTWSRPGSGYDFSFGKAYGIVIGCLAAVGIPMTEVSPQRWKKALGVPAAKDGARARASMLLPQAAEQWRLVKNDGRAESALIALYGMRLLSGTSIEKAA